MPQALHIFTKDVRRLRWEILVVLALAAAFVGAEVRRDQTDTLFNSTVLLPLAWIYLIARVIHAEALSGHKQFWLTRPYSWKSLLAAKALFVLAFVTLPMLIADVAIVAAEGFNPGSHLSGLLWEQLLWWLVFIIPTVVLAAVTTGLVEFVSWLLLLVGSLYVIGMNQRPNWAAWRWPHFTLDTVVLGSCAVIVVWQYARRRTAIAQAVIAGIFVAEALVFCFPTELDLPFWRACRRPRSTVPGFDLPSIHHVPPWCMTVRGGLGSRSHFASTALRKASKSEKTASGRASKVPAAEPCGGAQTPNCWTGFSSWSRAPRFSSWTWMARCTIG